MYAKQVLENAQNHWLESKALNNFLTENNFSTREEAINALIGAILKESIETIEKDVLNIHLLNGKTPKTAIESNTFNTFTKVKKAVETHPFFKS